jgi:FtsP/CotA-like multicopper oxidase with cupredoxin domain
VNQPRRNLVGRRAFLKAAGVAAASAATGLGFKRVLLPTTGVPYRLANYGNLAVKRYHITATDGFASMPLAANPIPPFWPDPDAADKAPYTKVGATATGLWVMGFRDVTSYHNTGTSDFPDSADHHYDGSILAAALAESDTNSPLTAAIRDLKGRAQIAAPLLYARVGDDLRLHLTNLGLQQRPDLVDSHTIHFHGFPNQTAYFDGVPDASLAAPIGRTLVYQYIPEDPGTYMYHCHFEDVEHVHMGLTGVVFIYPHISARPGEAAYSTVRSGTAPFTKFAYDTYNGTDNPSGFDREFTFILSEADVHVHYNDAHLQINDFSAYSPTFRLINGRAWPDTKEANIDARTAKWVDGVNPGAGAPPRLQYNPLSSLIQANAGEKVLLRISNLGFEVHSLVLPGIPMQMVGRDAKPLFKGRPDYLAAPPAPGFPTNVFSYGAGARGDATVMTTRVDIGPGESRDLIFTAPSVSSKTVFPFYDRNEAFAQNNAGDASVGGMRTEVHVFPTGSLAPQLRPNHLLSSNGDM